LVYWFSEFWSAVPRHRFGTMNTLLLSARLKQSGVGRALAVDAVLEGSLQRENGRVRLTLRVINVSNGTQMWSANSDESDKDIFRLQDSLLQEVAKKLFGELSRPEKGTADTSTNS